MTIRIDLMDVAVDVFFEEDLVMVGLPGDWRFNLKRGEMLDVEVLTHGQFPTIQEYCDFFGLQPLPEADPESDVGDGEWAPLVDLLSLTD